MMANEMDKNLLDLFWRLPSIDSIERVTAEVSMIDILKQKQALIVDDCSNELQYTLGRLIKGVASSRAAARLGFAATLTGVIQTFPQITIEDILEKTNKFLKICGTPKEQLNVIFGRLLVYHSLIISKRILENGSCLLKLLADLENLRTRKCVSNLYLQAIIQILGIIDLSTFETQMWPFFENELSQGWSKCRIDQLVILLKCSHHFPTLINKSFLKLNWGCKKVICSDTLTSIQNILGEVSTDDKYGLYLLLQHLANNESIKIFNLFWNNVINKGLLQSTNQNKIYIVFELIENILPILSISSQVDTVLSDDAMMQIKKAYENDKNILNSASLKLVKSFISALNSNVNLSETIKETVAVSLLNYIAANPLCPISAYLTQFNNMKDIISLLNNEQLITYESILRNLYLGIFQHECKGEKLQARIFAITNLSRLFMLQNTNPQRQKSIMKFLVLHSYFHLQEISKTVLHCDEIPQDNIPVVLRNTTKNAFNKVMETIASKSKLQTSRDFLYSLILYIQEIMQNTNLTPLFSWDEEVKDEWDKMIDRVVELHENTPKGIEHDPASAFEVLFLSMAIQLLIDPKETLEVLQDLHVCYEKASDKIKKSCLDEDEPNWIDVVVDLLLSLLSRSKRVLRCIVSSVFRLLVPFLTLSSLQLILDAINPEKNFDDESDDQSNYSDDSLSSNENDSEDDIQVDEEFKNKLQVVLGNAFATPDQDSDLSDSAMFQLDDKLSEAFQEKFGNKKKSKEILHFNNRCLELINIYISNHPKMNLTLQLIQPLFTIIDICRKKPDYKIMENLCISILKKMCKIRKFDDPIIESDTSGFVDQLKEMVLKSQCIEEHSLVQLFENASMFIVFCLQHSKSDMEDVVNIFEAALQEFLEHSHCQNLTVLNGLIRRYSNIAWKLHRVLVKFSLNFEIKVFKRMMICNVFSELCSRQTDISVKQWKKMCLLLSADLPEILNKAVEENKKGYLQALFTTIHTILFKKQFKETSLAVLAGSLDIFETVLPKLPKKEARICKLFIGKLKPQNNQEVVKKRKKKKNLSEKMNLYPTLLPKVKKIKMETPK